MKHVSRIVAMLAAAALAVPAVYAERTRFWRQSSFEEFDKGTANGVALRSDGKLVLAPRFAQFADPNAAYLWALRVDSKGTLYAAGGTNAKVFRFDAQGNPTTIFESAEMAAQALAIDAQDNLYIGTSPDGKVYKIPRAARPGDKPQATVFFEPKTKYIWDLAVDASGTVFVATGDKGEVFAVSPTGQGQLFYKSDETHVRALAFDAKGNLVLGTEPNGLIVRVEMAAPPAGGTRSAFVIYETAKKEVTSLLADRAGNLYIAAVGDKTRFPQPGQPVPPQPVQQTVTAAGQTVTTTIPQPAQQPTPFTPFPPLSGGEVYRITPDGAPESLWTSRDALVYSLGFSSEGRVLLGTGNRGLALQLEGNNVFSNLAKTAAGQVTSIVAGPGGRIFIGTANPGKLFTLGPDYEPEGRFESQTFDARIFSQWGRLTWWGENGAANGQVEFYARSGNTSDPEKSWSPWTGPYRDAKGSMIAAPPARFVQWKAVFKAKPADTPNISWVSLAYLPKNVAPTVDSVLLQNPNVRLQGFQAPAAAGAAQPAPVRMPPPPTLAPGQTVPPQQPQPARFEPPPQGFLQRGAQSVIWGARDENEDDLAFTIYFRGEGETNWRVLKDRVEQKFFTWDTTAMPDGAYYLKIVASDAGSNPPEEALTGERESDRFEVDNTPPRVENLRAEPQSPAVRIRFDARDSYSALARAEYSLNAGEWKTVFPVERVTDSPQESYEVALKDLPPGEHTVAIRVFDQFENTSSAKVTFVVPPPGRR